MADCVSDGEEVAGVDELWDSDDVAEIECWSAEVEAVEVAE